MLKCDEKFLYVLSRSRQEQNIKTGRFSMIYADEVVVSHTNENEYTSFVGNKKNEALQDRIILVKVPYNLRVERGGADLREAAAAESALQNVHIAPHTLRVASLFAILSRLEPPKKAGMSLMKKLKLYDGEDVEGFNQQGRRGAAGGDGRARAWTASARATSSTGSPARSIRGGHHLHQPDRRAARAAGRAGPAHQHQQGGPGALPEPHRRGAHGVRRAGQDGGPAGLRLLASKRAARTLLNNYLDNVEAFCNRQKVRDPITDEEVDPDEKLMRSIEEQIGVTENAKKTFREEILIRMAAMARKGQKFDYTSHERLQEAIEKKLFADLKDVVKITTSTKTPDAEQLKQINEVVDRLVDEHGYCPSARTSCCGTWARC